MAAYDTVFIGYPIWYGYEPMAIRTFLESYDWRGKTVVPFCTSGGSSISDSESSIAGLLPDATMLSGLTISGSQAAESGGDIAAWLSEIGISH